MPASLKPTRQSAPVLRMLSGDGLMLAADAYGDPAAPPILFFHGGGQSRNAWRGSAQRVAEAGYYGLSLDLRGHGDSGWSARGDYLLDAYARDVELLIGQFDQPVVLVGASRGGQAALVGGARHPARVRLIMLADVAPLIADDGVDDIRAFFRASDSGFASLDDAAEALHRHLHQPRIADAAKLERSMRCGADGRLYWRWDPKTAAPAMLNPPSEGEALLAAAAAVKSPLMLVRAEHSTIVTQAGVDAFRALAPQLEVIEAKGVGHMFTGDRNDGFAASLLERLARQEGRSP